MGAHTGTSPLTQRELIAEYFMEHRVQVLELAAFLDRLDRAREIDADDDFRLRSIPRRWPCWWMASVIACSACR